MFRSRLGHRDTPFGRCWAAWAEIGNAVQTAVDEANDADSSNLSEAVAATPRVRRHKANESPDPLFPWGGHRLGAAPAYDTARLTLITPIVSNPS